MTFAAREASATAVASNGEIVAVRDAANRDLLTTPEPLVVKPSEATTITITVAPAGPWQIRVSSDQSWLKFDRSLLEPDNRRTIPLRLVVLPEGTAEFAVLRFGWNSPGETCAEHVLVWRKPITVEPPTVPPAPLELPMAQVPTEAPPAPTPTAGTTPLPDWLAG